MNEPMVQHTASTSSALEWVLLAIMKASDLPWWAWLLFAAMFEFVAADGLVGIISKRVMDPFSVTLTLVLLIIGIFCAVVGLVRFVKWAWKG
jgi:hypothetical protein